MEHPTIWQHLPELWQLALGVTILAVPAIVYVVKLSTRVKELSLDHRELREELKNKTDKITCEKVHSSQRENMDVVIKVIESGNKLIRDDIRHLTIRLDDHIQKNGG